MSIMKSAMNGGLTIEDVKKIQQDAQRMQSRRLREAAEDGLFEPTKTPSGDTRDLDRPIDDKPVLNRDLPDKK